MKDLNEQLRVSGVISVHSRGFGFLNGEMEGEPFSAFVAPPVMNRFLAGDVVSAQIVQGSDGRFSAEDLRLESRKRAVLFGEVTKRKGRLFLKTDGEVANTDWPLIGEAKPGEFILAQVDGDEAHLAWALDLSLIHI